MVIIGIDPHKGSHTAAVIEGDEELVGELLVCAARSHVILRTLRTRITRGERVPEHAPAVSPPVSRNGGCVAVMRAGLHRAACLDGDVEAQFVASSCLAVTNAASVPQPGETSFQVSIERSIVASAAVG